MLYCVEILRDEDQNVAELRILSASNDVFPTPRGRECVLIAGPATDDLSCKSATMDQDGVISIEDDQDKIDAKAAEAEIALRMARQDFGRRLIAIISIRNDAKSFTQEQIEQFMSDYAIINTALLNGSIATAKALIQAITPDGVVTTQGDKDALLGEISGKEAELGYV